MGKSREPVFDPWQTSVFHVVKQPRDDYGEMPTLQRSKSRMDSVDEKPAKIPRYYTTTSTQPVTKLPEIKTDYDIVREYGGYINSRPVSRSQGANNFYQRIAGRMSYEPQTSRRSDDRIPRVHMDGANKHYVEPGPPLFRAGRAGAPWRHIKQCIGNLGNHICFVDGQVKENDMKRFPPYGYVETPEHLHMPRLGTAPTKRYDSATESNHGNQTSRYNSTYNNHAKQGFKYWHEDKSQPGAAGTPKRTIQGRMMKMGIGY